MLIAVEDDDFSYRGLPNDCRITQAIAAAVGRTPRSQKRRQLKSG